MAIPPDQGQASPDQGQAAPPVCYRHPGRPTYVSCVRCGKPACPDCLRPAAVGHQCVDCIRSGNRTVRQAAGRFGGAVTANAKVTWTLLALNVVLYLIELAHAQLGYDWAMVGAGRLTQSGPLVGVAVGQWYRLITSAFIPPPGVGYLGFLDIAFNMWALFVVGPAVERALGHARFLAVYLISGIGGSILLYYLVPFELAAGASGAIFGLFGAWFVLARRLQADVRPVVLLIVINLALGFSVAQIAWQAHVGGLIAGGLITAAYAYAPKRNRTAIQVGATVAMVALFVLAVLIRNHQLLDTFSFYQGRLF
ncbi:MAG TPA: rhomboid family intramembrane serine protease [Streptosporangiaceae bacterium]|nr:rhomboid family intramembrane serine protease [Streptosporangiaceae bacterium]